MSDVKLLGKLLNSNQFKNNLKPQFSYELTHKSWIEIIGVQAAEGYNGIS
jgi:hypothetical protein